MKVDAEKQPTSRMDTRAGEIYECAAELIVEKGFGHAHRKYVQRTVQQLHDADKLRVPRVDLAARNLLSTLRGIAHWYPLTPNLGLEEAVENTVSFILGGLLKPEYKKVTKWHVV